MEDCRPSRIKPRRLKKGDTVAVVAPASPLTVEKFEKAIANIESFGIKTKIMPHVRVQNGYLAGTDDQRLKDLHAAFADASCAGVWCARGGYGTARLLDNLDFDLIRRNPKVFVGYSDITALHCAIHDQTGLVTFHGPVGTSKMTDYTRQHLEKTIFEPVSTLKIDHAPDNLTNPNPLFRPEIIVGGRAKGQLTGGNLSLLSAAAGTKFFPNIKGKILFIEDIDERPYRVDRMLVQILQSVDLHQAAALALGTFEGCKPNDGENSLTLSECLRDLLQKLKIPVVYGLSFGHIDHQFTLPVGIEAELDASQNAEKMSLTLLETAVL